MNNTQPHEVLIDQANRAAIQMMRGVGDLIEIAGAYMEQGEVVTESDAIKREGITSAVEELARLTKLLGAEVVRWKKEEPRIISRSGIEGDILNELMANVESSLMFFIMENQDLGNFNRDEMKAAYSDLVRCNQLL